MNHPAEFPFEDSLQSEGFVEDEEYGMTDEEKFELRIIEENVSIPIRGSTVV